MRKYFICAVMLLCFVLCGCDNTLDVSFPDNPIKFETYVFHNPDNPERSTMAFDYNNRTYIYYSSLDNTISKKDVGKCLGYIVQEGVEKKDIWVVELKAFENDDFLMEYFPYGGMQIPIFYRAIDTKGQNIELPNYISDYVDDYWK